MIDQPVTFEFELDDDPDADWRVRRMELHEKLGDLYFCSLELAHKESTLGEEVSTLLGASCCLTVARDATERQVRGIIRQVVDRGVAGSPEPYARVQVQVVPALWVLSKRRDARIFQGQTLPETVTEVIAEGVKSLEREGPADALTRTDYPVRDYCTQYAETDLNFVMRLLQESGVALAFTHEGETEQLTLYDANETYPDGPELDGLADEPTLLSFTPAQRVHTKRVLTFDVNWPEPNVGIEGAAGEEDGNGLLVYESDVCPAFADGDSDGQQAQIRYDLEVAQASLASGASRVVDLMPGQRCQISADQHDGSYLITEVVAVGTSTEELGLGMEDIGGREEYVNTFRCLRDDIPFRPLRTAKRPSIAGFQSAVVVGESEDVHTDEHGRVKVRFNWDRHGKWSCWLRVAQAWAGQGFGAWFLPRVGMEVAVIYQNGDPDQPIVVGCLHNGENPTPYLLPENKEKSGIVTNSSNANRDGKGHNRLTFEDVEGSEEVYFQAQRDLNLLAKNNQTVTVGDEWPSDDEQKRKKHDLHRVKTAGNRTVVVGKGAREAVAPQAVSQFASEADLKLQHFGRADDGNSEWKVVTGNQRQEIRGNRSRIVGGGEGATGDERIEILGTRSLQVHGDNDEWWKGYKYESVGGLCFKEFCGIKVEFSLAATVAHQIGVKLAFFDGAALSHFAGAKLDIAHGGKFTIGKLKELNKQEDDAVQLSIKDHATLAQGSVYVKSNAAIRLTGGSGETFEESLADPLGKLGGPEKKELVSGDFAARAAYVGQAVKTATSEAKKIQELADKIESDVKKAMAAAKKAEDTGQMILEQARAMLQVGDKQKLEIDGQEVTITCGDHQIKMKSGTIDIKSSGKIKLDSSQVIATGKLEAANFSSD